MDLSSLLSVNEVAGELGLTRQKVVAFIGEGRLPAIKVGADWRVSVLDLTRFAQVRRRPGRPLGATHAWRVLLEGERSGHVQVVRRGPGLDAFGLAHLVRRRAAVHRLHALDRLVADVAGHVIAGGESAARVHRFAPHSAHRFADGYVRRSELAALTTQFALRPAIGDEINVWLRVTDDDLWPFEPGSHSVGPLVAATDMIGDPVDDRSIESAVVIADGYLR